MHDPKQPRCPRCGRTDIATYMEAGVMKFVMHGVVPGGGVTCHRSNRPVTLPSEARR